MYLGSITVERLDDKKVNAQSHVEKKAGSSTLIVQQHHLIVRELMVGYLEVMVKKAMEAAGGYKRVRHLLYKVIVEET